MVNKIKMNGLLSAVGDYFIIDTRLHADGRYGEHSDRGRIIYNCTPEVWGVAATMSGLNVQVYTLAQALEPFDIAIYYV